MNPQHVPRLDSLAPAVGPAVGPAEGGVVTRAAGVKGGQPAATSAGQRSDSATSDSVSRSVNPCEHVALWQLASGKGPYYNLAAP